MLLGCWVVGLSVGCWLVGLLGYGVVGLSFGCWFVRLLGCWVAGLIGCYVVVPHVPHLLYQIAKYLKVAQDVSVYFLLIHF